MSNVKAVGGNVKAAKAKARVEIASKSALIAVPVPKAPPNPSPMLSTTFEEAIQNLNVNFKFNLRKLDNSTQKEEFRVTELGQLEENELARNSKVLREQVLQKNFLHKFQYELRHNRRFKAQLQEMLTGTDKDELMAFLEHLKAWIGHLKKPSQPFLEWLKD